MRILGCIMLVLAALWTSGAQAQTCTASTAAVAFGNYAPFSGSAVTTTGTVTVTCVATFALGISYTISLSVGGGTSFAARSMGPSSPRLGYQLYRDSAMSQIWGDGTAGTFTLTDGYLLAILVPVTRNYTVYGKIPASQNCGIGMYTDPVGVLVSY